MKRYDISLIYLRFIAILLVTNSHLDNLYLKPIYATGGALGNSLFFFISGTCLTLSQGPIKYSFIAWYSKRLIRIYPALWVAVLIYLFFKEIQIDSLAQLITLLIVPKDFWFLPALALFYIPAYFFIKSYKESLFIILSITFVVIYAIYYLLYIDKDRFSIEDYGCFKVLFYFYIMMMGIYFAKKINHLTEKTGWLDFFYTITLSALYFFLKYYMSATSNYTWQFGTHFLVIPWVFYLARTLSTNYFVSVFNRISIGFFITLVSGITLEMYVLQRLFYNNDYIKSIEFPLNILVFFLFLIVSSLILRNIIKRLDFREGILRSAA